MKKVIKKLIPFSIPLLLLLIGLYLVPIKIFEPNFTKIIGDMGDARFNNYILEHGYKYLHGEVYSFWDAPMMYPIKNVIAFSDNLLGTMPIYSFFRFIGYDRETSFQYWIISLFVLNFICFYLVLFRWSKNNILSAVSAYIFAFGIYNIAHLYHVQVLPKFIAPFVIYWFWRFLSKHKLKYFLYSSLGLVYQFYCVIYLGFFLIYGLLFFFIAYFIIFKNRDFFANFRKIKYSLYFFFIVAISAILLSFLLIPYINITKVTGMCHYEDIVSNIPRPISYFFTPLASKSWHILSLHSQYAFPNWWIQFNFVGALPWIGIILSVFLMFSKKNNAEQKKFNIFLLLSLALNISFCLNINDYSLYKFIFYLPGFSSMRSINRILNIQIMFFLFIFVFAFNDLLKTKKVVKSIIFLLPILVVVDNLIDVNKLKRFDKLNSQNKVNEIVQNISSQYNKKFKAIAYMPIISKPTGTDIHQKLIELNISSMLAAQELNIPIVNAYTGHYPKNYMPFFDNLNYTTLTRWCNYNKCDVKKIQPIYDIGVNVKRISIINLKASNGKFVCDDDSKNDILIANRKNPLRWETFTLITLENNKYGLISFKNKFITTEIDKKNEIMASRSKLQGLGKFTLQRIDYNHFAIKAVNNKYITLDTNTGQLFATATTVGENEIFELVYK